MDRILPKIAAILIGGTREKVENIRWSNSSWTHNFFRFLELIFWRKQGIRPEAAIAGDGKIVVYQFFTLEAFLAHLEHKIRTFAFPELIPVRIWVPVFSTPGGLPVPASPYLFAIAFDAATDGTKTSASSHTVSVTTTGSNIFLCAGFNPGNMTTDDVTSVVFNTTETLSLIARQSDPVPTMGFSTWIYGKMGVTATTANVVLTFGASYDIGAGYCMWSYSGVQGGARNSDTNQNASVGAYSRSITPDTDHCWVVAAFGTGGTASSGAGAGTTKRNASSLKIVVVDNNADISPAASTTLNITDGGTTNVKQVVIFALARDSAVTTISVSDQLNITDVPFLTKIFNFSVSDQLNITEAVTMTRISNVSVSDQLTITESVTRSVQDFINVSDQLTITETALVYPETVTFNVSDQLTITESTTITPESFISVSDQITITESFEQVIVFFIDVSDQITVSESATVDVTSFFSVSDQLTATDVISREASDPVKGLVYMRGQDQGLPVTLNKQDYPLSFNDTSVS